MINDNTALTILKSKGIYCIECSIINEYTAGQIKEIINLYRKSHPDSDVCVITKNTASINSDALDTLSDVDNLFIRLSSVYNENILSKCNKKNQYDLLSASLYKIDELKRINYKIDKIISKISTNWSKAQIAIYIYDYIMRNTKYDPEYFDKASFNIRSLRGFLSQETVCAGYSYMYKELMDRLNIPCEYLIGETTSSAHAWNSVSFNGKTYYCDLTWDSQCYKGDSDNEHMLRFFAQDVEKFEKIHKPFKGFGRSYKGPLSSMTSDEKKKLLSSVMSYSENYNFESFKMEDGSIIKVAKIGSYDEFSPESNKSLKAYVAYNIKDNKASSPNIYLADFDLDKERKILDDLKLKREKIKRDSNLTELEKSKELKELNDSFVQCRNRFIIISKMFSKKHTDKIKSRNEQYLGGIKDNEYFYDKDKRNSKIRTRTILRGDSSPAIVIDPCFKTKVSGIDLNTYNIITLSKEQSKFNFKKYKVLTENNLLAISKSTILTNEFLSDTSLKNCNKSHQGYLGYIKDNKWYYNPNVLSILKKSLLSYSIDGSLSINVNHM